MKPLFFFLLAVLTVGVHADPYVFPPVRDFAVPPREVVTISEIPVYPVLNSIVTTVPETVYLGERIVIPVTHTVEKPTEKPIVFPKPLVPLLPLQTEEHVQIPETIRGQNRTVDNLAEVLDSPLPLPQGAVEEGTIDSKLIDTAEPSESDLGVIKQSLISAGPAGQGTKPADPLGYGVLLTAMAIIAIGLVYMVFVAYDYRQRWMQSLTTQNDRYLGGGVSDWETEDSYSSPATFSEGFGLTRRSSI
jgi:hypothetical protein